MALVVVGGGKMGMSHLAIATKYLGKKNVSLIDQSIFTRLLFRILGYQTFSSVENAKLQLDSIDGVLIATPTNSHFLLAEWSIKNGIPCFIEKPLTLDIVKSEALLKLNDIFNVPVQLGFVMRYVRSFQKLHYIVKYQLLGEVVNYRATMKGNVISSSPDPSNWQGIFAQGGGCLNEYGPHILDLCLFIFGSVSSVERAQYKSNFCKNADDETSAQFRHASGALADVFINWSDPSMRKSIIEFKVDFENGFVRVDNSAVEIEIYNKKNMSVQVESFLIQKPLPFNVGYYLRGEEFSLELETFFNNFIATKICQDSNLFHNTTPKLYDGYLVDQLIDKIAHKANLK